jgi:hypothetical protein
MMGLLLTLLALVSTYGVTRYKGVGHGLGVLLLFGYFYGILRARFPDGLSHFMFDAGVFGLYLAWFTRRSRSKARVGREGQALRLWVKVLMVWPLCTLVLSPLLDAQHILIQFVGLRMAILLLPLMLIGLRLEPGELDVLGTWVVWLNAVAFGFALLELALGIEPFFPRNASSFIIYISQDVGEEGLPRIPAIFNSAHAYAGTMLMSMPLLVRRLGRSRSGRFLSLAALGVSLLGIFISAARSPVVQLVAIVGLLLLVSRLSAKLLAAIVGMAIGVGLVVATNPRFQRFATLDDTSYVTERLSASVNTSLLEVITNYPLGNGLGSAAGTSIPFFLTDLAKPQFGLENEFARVAMEQGFIGFVLWLGFLAWLLLRLPPRRRKEQVVANRLMWATVVVMWMTAFIGTGLLASVPGSALLLLWMGCLIGMRRPVPAPAMAPARTEPPVRPEPSPVVPLPRLPEAVRR